MTEEFRIGALVKPVKRYARRWRGVHIIKSVDRYNVILEPVSGGKPLYFGPKTFWQYWEPVYMTEQA